MKLEDLINHSAVLNFCKNIKKFNLNANAKMCGVDFYENILRLKLYVELLHIPETKILQEFLDKPVCRDFYAYSGEWDSSRPSGLALGLKIDTKSNIQQYFHIKTNKSLDSQYDDKLVFLKLLNIHLKNLKTGVSIESSNSLYNKKIYYYISNIDEISRVLAYKKIYNSVNLEEIEELEIYTSKDKYKINIINKMYNFKINQDVWKITPTCYRAYLEDCINLLQIEPAYAGYTSNNIYSVYFSLTNTLNNIFNI